MNFKQWIMIEEDETLIQQMLDESFGQAAEFGFDIESFQDVFDKVKNVVAKIDKVVGMKKFVTALPAAAFAQVMLVFAVMQFAKNPTDMQALQKVVGRLTEATKLGVYSGATIPIGAAIGGAVAPGFGEVIGAVMAKALSWGYFYLGQWAENNLNSPKFGKWAARIQELMPKSMKEKKSGNWFSKLIGK